MNVTIDVTETHLRDGIDCDCHKCPIALALMDVTFLIGGGVKGVIAK